jgi:hypothetical protein
MPFTIIKSGDKYKLRNQKTGNVSKKSFLTKDSAKRASENYMKHEKGKKKEQILIVFIKIKNLILNLRLD